MVPSAGFADRLSSVSRWETVLRKQKTASLGESVPPSRPHAVFGLTRSGTPVQPPVAWQLTGQLKFGGFGPHFTEAIAAIDRTVAAGPEGHHGIGTALSADDWVHLSWLVGIHPATSTTLLCAPHCPATPATFGFVGESSSVKKFLLPRSKNKLSSTLHTN